MRLLVHVEDDTQLSFVNGALKVSKIIPSGAGADQ